MMTKTNTKKSSTMARVALGATAVLALAGHAHAALCTLDQKVTGGVCAPCTAGMKAAYQADTAGGNSFCELLAPNYYGSVGNGADATGVTACPYAGTRAGTANTDKAIGDCTPNCGTDGLMENNGAGLCQCIKGAYGQPSATSAAAVNGGCTKCITTFSGVVAASVTTTSQGTQASPTTNTACLVADGYYLSTIAGGIAANVRTTAVPNNYYKPFTSVALFSATAVDIVKVCPDNTATVLGANTLDDCYVNDGYRVSVAGGGAGSTAGTVVACAVNTYFKRVGYLRPVTATGTESCTACPYAGTSAVASASRSACTPDCSTTWSNTNAIAQDGTCVCAATYYGTPYDAVGFTTIANAAVTGCTACSTTFSGAIANSVTSAAGAAAANDCTVAPGYYVSGVSSGVNALTITAQVPANKYVTAGQLLSGGLQVPTQCPKHSTAAAGASDISACKCVANYASTSNSCEYCPGQAAGTAVGTHTTCAATTTTTTAATPGAPGAPAAASGASSVSVFAAAAAIAAAQLVL